MKKQFKKKLSLKKETLATILKMSKNEERIVKGGTGFQPPPGSLLRICIQ